MVNRKTFHVHVILHQACFYYYYYYYYYYFLNGDQCFMSGDYFYNYRLQTGVLGALHCHVYSNNNYCHSTFSAVQILKIAYIRRDPLTTQTVYFSLKGFVCVFTECWSSQKNVFFVYFYQEMVNSKSCSWEECKRQ